MAKSDRQAAQMLDSRGAGAVLREWRRARGLSQLQLALEADISTRHLSFIETGRSAASARVLMELAAALDLPLREVNVLLQAGGYAPAFRETGLDDPEMEYVQRALLALLERYEPNAASVFDSRWNLLMTNRPMERTLCWLLGCETLPPGLNLVRLAFDPDGMRPFVKNWQQVATYLLAAVRRQARASRDPRVEALLEALLAMPGVGDLPPFGPAAPAMPLTLAKDGIELAMFAVVSTLGSAHDVTSQELRLEVYFPADAASEKTWAALGGALGAG